MLPQSDTAMMRQRLKKAAWIAGGVLGAILIIGIVYRFVETTELKSWTSDEDIPTVAVVLPAASSKGQELVLPGTLQAFYDAPIYARVPGYIHAWYKDIGAQVKKGDLLASVDTPELDQQIGQARADVAAAAAAENLSATTAKRWNELLPLDAVSKQDAEEKNEDLASKASATKAAQANLDRLLALKGFGQIIAPFDGVVTARTVDEGALVNAGSSSSASPLFSVSDVSNLRVYVDVPQSYASQIVPGMRVSLTVPEYPQKSFPAHLVSTSNAINTHSATLLVEFEASNESGLLKPGDYAQVSMGLPNANLSLRLPASALLFRAAGLQVATVRPNNRILMKPIKIGTDLGTQVIVSSGLEAHDRVVDNPPDSIANGDQVRVEPNGHAS